MGRERERERQTDRQTQRETHTHTAIERYIYFMHTHTHTHIIIRTTKSSTVLHKLFGLFISECWRVNLMNYAMHQNTDTYNAD